jgi:carbon-monoxide dehydrogenase large subunit
MGNAFTVTETIEVRIPAYPTGCAICELEVDPETGVVEIQNYTTVDDVGQPINPLVVDGQVHGGIAQGVGQALHEGIEVDEATGQVLGASFMDYGVPHADNLPSFNVFLVEDPTPHPDNRLRIKGGGEGGITPATAVVINALINALKPCGVEHIEMPATPARVWASIQSARAAQIS